MANEKLLEEHCQLQHHQANLQ